MPKTNADGAGSGNAQSGGGKNGSALPGSFAVSQPDDNVVAPATKSSDLAAASATAGTQIPHSIVGKSEPLGSPANAASRSTDFSPSATADADARAEAAAALPNSLHSARLVDHMGMAELRVGVQAGEFGNVDIRTSMVRNQVTAQISVERGELGKVLAAELPSLQNRLSEHRLPNANIVLQNQSSGGSAGFGQGSRQSQNLQQIAIPQISDEPSASPSLISAETNAPTARLDIHM